MNQPTGEPPAPPAVFTSGLGGRLRAVTSTSFAGGRAVGKHRRGLLGRALLDLGTILAAVVVDLEPLLVGVRRAGHEVDRPAGAEAPAQVSAVLLTNC